MNSFREYSASGFRSEKVLVLVVVSFKNSKDIIRVLLESV
jgi:hypothetical protein